MYRISHEPLVKHVALMVAALMVFPYGFAPLAAYGQVFTEITSVVVLPMQDLTGHDSFMASQKATDAVAMALEDSGEFRVISKRALAVALADLGLVPPLMEAQQARLGEHLKVDKVVSGTLYEISVNSETGECRVTIEIRAMDIFLGWILDGAKITVQTRPIPGWGGDDVTVVNEALRQAAEQVVREMLRRHVIRGKVDAVDNRGMVTLNIGLNEGAHDGQRMLVVRSAWNKDIQQVKARVVGEIELFDVRARFSKARALGDSLWPQTGDYVYAQYTTPEMVSTRRHRQAVTGSLRMGAAVLMLLGVLAIGKSKGTIKPPVAQAQIGQASPGGTPFVRVNLERGLIPDSSQVHAWIFYRGQSPGLIAEVENIVGATAEPRLPFYEDTAEARYGVTFTTEFQYLDRSNEMTDGSVDITYNDLALLAGDTYFYKVQRIVDPIQPVVSITTQVGLAQEEELEDAEMEVDPPDAKSEPSATVGPVTYFEPGVLTSPRNNAGGVNPDDVTFEWTPSVGADQYQVEVYDNPTLAWPPVYQSGSLSWTGQTVMTHTVTDFDFAGSTTYWWVVGNRRRGEALPLSYVSGQYRSGWIYSSPFTFTTVEKPPEPYSARAASDRPSRPTAPSGFWGERRLGSGAPRR